MCATTSRIVINLVIIRKSIIGKNMGKKEVKNSPKNSAVENIKTHKQDKRFSTDCKVVG